MPKHTISYEHLSGAEKQEKAINDIREYIGKDSSFYSIVEEIKTFKPSEKSAKILYYQFSIFSGVSGYPIIAILSSTWDIDEDQIYKWIESEDSNGN